MKDRDASVFAAAGLCVAVALLRMLAPGLPFDWMTLLLVLAAAAALLVPALAREAAPRRPRPAPTALMAEMETLRQRMAKTDWSARSGGMYDALRSLFEDKPFVAVCAARGMLLMLAQRGKLVGEEAETLSRLGDALDAAAQAGGESADPGTVEALFSYAMRALGRLENAG